MIKTLAIIASVKSSLKKLSLVTSSSSLSEIKAPGSKKPIPTPKMLITESAVVAITLFFLKLNKELLDYLHF